MKAGTRTAIIGPTAAGKTQLLYLLTGLLAPTSGQHRLRRPSGRGLRHGDAAPAGRLRLPGRDDVQPDAAREHRLQQDRERCRSREGDRHRRADRRSSTRCRRSWRPSSPSAAPACRADRSSASCWRGRWRSIRACCCSTTSPRASTPRPSARFSRTWPANYPALTLVSVTQKIAPVEDYDQIVLLMEGEVLATGTHQHLLDTCPEYVQIYDSQRSTRHYESVHAH